MLFSVLPSNALQCGLKYLQIGIINNYGVADLFDYGNAIFDTFFRYEQMEDNKIVQFFTQQSVYQFY